MVRPQFTFSQTTASDDDVRMLLALYLLKAHLPLDCTTNMQTFIKVADESGTVQCVFGWRDEGQLVHIDDFYLLPGRIGILAAYEALRWVRDTADKLGITVATATPHFNHRMMRASEKIFDLPGPTHYLYQYEGKR